MATKSYTKFKEPNFDWELKLGEVDGCCAGVDEVGYGALAGPVVAAAVILPFQAKLPGIRDSKSLNESRREIFDVIIRKLGMVGIGIATVQEIDKLNILQANFLAMYRAIEALPFSPKVVIIDGVHVPPFLKQDSVPLINGDKISMSVSAASICAKVYRDKYMRDLALIYNRYGWHTNVGYGTKEHLDALHNHGANIWHRHSFLPVKRIVCAVK